MSFSFGQPSSTNPPFGQSLAFGTQQQAFGAAVAPSATAPQFGSTFGAAAPSTGVQFGSTTSTPSLFGQPQASSGLSFGATPATAAPAFGNTGVFGAATTPSTGLTFGTATAPGTGLAFGAATTPSTGLAFGAASSLPSTGLTFSAATSAPTFGTGLTFGTPTSAPGFGATPQLTTPSFGLANTFSAPASTQSTTLTFGTSTTTPSTLRFGTPASAGLTFGSTPKPTVSFGNTAPSSATSTGLTFATPATKAPLFGTTSNTGLSFGSTAVTTSGVTLGIGAPFNLTTTQGSGLTLGSSTTTPNVSLGTGTTFNIGSNQTATSTAGTLNLPTKTTATTGGLTLGTTITPSTGLTFGGTPTLSFTSKPTDPPKFPLTSTTTTASGLTFNATPASTTASSLFGGTGLATTTPASTSFLGLGGIPTTKIITATTAAPPIGLGGIPTTTTKQTLQNEPSTRDQPLPNEILQTVDAFKAFLKDQKANSSEIARFSIKELKTVETNIFGVNNTMNELENELQKNKCMAEKLKLDSAHALQYAEMAQRTFETPAGMQYDNTAPIKFFVELLQNFERDLQQLRFHLEYVNKQVNNGNMTSDLTPEDLSLGLRRLHQTFVTLAGRLQSVHNQVEVQRDRYLTLRKEVLNDSSNVFESQNKELEALEYALKSISNENKLPEIAAGPSPFNSLGTGQAQLLAQNPPTYPGTPPLGPTSLGAANTTLGLNATPLFGATLGTTSSIFNSSTSNSFQLQKPPTGSKRGKT